MQFLYLLATAVVLYFLSDWLLRGIEAKLERTLEHRSIFFFALFLGSLLISFEVIRSLLAS